MSNNKLIETAGDAVFVINGNLNFANAEAVLAQGSVLFTAGKDVTLNLAHVAQADSAGLAILLEWQDIALQQGIRLIIQNTPSSLLDLACLSNCLELLNLG